METYGQSMRILEEAKQYITEKQDLLRRAYGDDCIAVREGVVLGSHDDKFKLAREMKGKFPEKSILISTIDDIINPQVTEIPSSEVERR